MKWAENSQVSPFGDLLSTVRVSWLAYGWLGDMAEEYHDLAVPTWFSFMRKLKAAPELLK